ncbi:MAG: acyl carrier protein, partial [Albidovulum sp.]|uniref:acyl carrier protein n=1 Tax=Albidovulum sp. TaxID=1872424 RepID=UPI003CBD20E2
RLFRGQIRKQNEPTIAAEKTDAPAVGTVSPVPDWMVQRICGYVSDVAGQDLASADGDLFELGFDSLRGMRLIERIETGLLHGPSQLSLADLSDLRTPRAIAAVLSARATRNTKAMELVL